MRDPAAGRLHGLTKSVADVDHGTSSLPRQLEMVVADHLEPATVSGSMVGVGAHGATHVHITKKGEAAEPESGHRREEPMPGLQRLILASQKVIPLRISAGA